MLVKEAIKKVNYILNCYEPIILKSNSCWELDEELLINKWCQDLLSMLDRLLELSYMNSEDEDDYDSVIDEMKERFHEDEVNWILSFSKKWNKELDKFLKMREELDQFERNLLEFEFWN